MEVNGSPTEAPDRIWEFPIPGGMVLADPNREGLYLLNHTSAFLWVGFRSGSKADEMVLRYAAAFGVPFETADRDVKNTLASWAELFRGGGFREIPWEDAPGGGSSFHIDLNGTAFRLVLDTPEMAAEVLPRVRHLAAAPAAGELEVPVTGREVSKSRALVLQELVRLSRGCEWLALLHAGACATESGCVVFAGASGSGKTTLAAALMASGFLCHADDSVGIEQGTLLIPPMPWALAVREGSWGAVGARCAGFYDLPVVERFGQQVRFLPPGAQAGAAPAVALVFPRYEAGARTEVRQLEVLEALVALKEAGFWVLPTREGIQEFLDWVGGIKRYRLVYSDPDEAVTFFRGVVG